MRFVGVQRTFVIRSWCIRSIGLQEVVFNEYWIFGVGNRGAVKQVKIERLIRLWINRRRDTSISRSTIL